MDTGDPIAALSAQLHMPPQQVREIYTAQLDRLAGEARIEDFLTILAIRNARAILRAVAPGTDTDDENDAYSDEE
jgi:hypothetical protein